MSNQIVDLEEALERVQDDHELLSELFIIFLEDYEEKRKNIGLLLESKKNEDLKNLAHSMKGAASNISAKRLFTSLLTLEKIAEENQLDQVPELLRTLDEQFTELKSHIEELNKKL